MKLLFCFIVFTAMAFGQFSRQVRFVATDPSGACGPSYIAQNIVTGNLMGCVSGVWTSLTGGAGAPGTVTSVGLVGTANQLTVTGASPITASGSWTISIPSALTLPGTINKLTLTAPATAATLTIPDGVTFTGPPASGTAATLAGTETLSGKTLTTPTISATGFANANHAHAAANSGGQLAEGALALTDVTTNNASTSAHGFAPKGTVGTTQYWRQDWTLGTPAGGGGTGCVPAGTSGQILTDDGAGGCTAITTSGTGNGIKQTSPTLVTPALGTPTSAVLTNATGTAAALTAGAATVLATTRAIYGNNFDGSAAITGPVGIAFGGTGTASTLTGLVRGSASAMTAAELSGDVSTSGSNAVTIATAAVTLAKMANIATASFIGRTTAATGVPEALTATQATALLNACSATVKGLVPTPPNNTTTFLRGDCTFATPAGSGDFVGPGSATDNAFVRFDGTTGKLGQNSTSATLDDTGNAAFASVATGDGTVAGGVSLFELTANGSNFRKFLVPNTLTANLTMTFPDTVPSAGQVMRLAAPSADVSAISWGDASGVGACGANTWASTLNNNAAPTCTQPAFTNISGSVTDAQVPDTIALTNLTQIGTRSHTDLTSIGTNTHAQIDTHLAATAAHGATGAVVGTTNTQVLTNKSLQDSTTTIEDNGDATKKVTFMVGNIATGTTRTFTFPDANSVGAVSSAAVSNQFLTEITTLGVTTRAQPSFANLSGAAVDAQIPNLNTLGTGLTASRCVETDGTGLLSVAAGVCGAGGGTVTSVGWTGGIVSIATATTTPAFTIAGTSGGVPYFSAATTWASSGVMAAGQFMLGGGAGAAPTTTFSVVPTANIAVALTNQTSINGITIPSAVGSATAAQVICSGTVALGTSAIASGAAATTVTATCTGLASTDDISMDFNASPLAVTGYVPSANGMLGIIKWPTTNTINVSVVNNTAASITPGAITLNYRVTR